jgi:hypothetical protein
VYEGHLIRLVLLSMDFNIFYSLFNGFISSNWGHSEISAREFRLADGFRLSRKGLRLKSVKNAKEKGDYTDTRFW